MIANYISSLLSYKRIDLSQEQRSFILKLVSGHDQTSKIKSYLRFRSIPNVSKDSEDLTSQHLQDLGILEVTKGKFLSSSRNYKLTTLGLFYIFKNISIYSPQFLVKYQDDIILKNLVFQFFDEKTIKLCTARFYSQLTSYIQECCNLSYNAINDINSTNLEDDKVKILDRLKFDLEWLIKRLCFKLTIMYNETNLLAINPELKDDVKVTLYELESKMKILLSKDLRFLELIENLHKDFIDGYNEIISLKSSNTGE